MKGETQIDLDGKSVRLLIVLEDIADAGRAMELIRNAARCAWPNVLFNFESPADAQEIESGPTPADWEKNPAPDGAETGKPEPPRKTQRDYSRSPRPGSHSERALVFCLKHQTTDIERVADALDMTNACAAALIAGLKRGGHLKGSPTCN